WDAKTGKPIMDASGNQRRGATQYLRIKIENRGWTFAQNVAVCVTNITCMMAGAGTTTFEEEVFGLFLANSAQGRNTFNLAAGAHNFIDLVHTQESLFLFTKPSGKLACFACPGARR